MNKYNIYHITLLSVLIFTVTACRTTNSLTIDDAASSGLYDILNEDASPCPTEDGEQYLFIRLYDPVYKNPFYMSTFLKLGIAATEVHRPLKLSHSSIGFDLTDNFFGLTLMPRPMLNEEHCTDVSTNDFMKQCKMNKSSQTTYALKVTSDEYNRAKNIVNEYRDANYSVGRVIKSGIRSVGRKLFHTKKNEGIEKALKTKKGTQKIAATMEQKRKFTCSSFVAFVLYNSVDEIAQYFNEYQTNLNYISVTDLAFLPGVTELFSSTWEDYNSVAFSYVTTNPEYKPYITREVNKNDENDKSD